MAQRLRKNNSKILKPIPKFKICLFSVSAEYFYPQCMFSKKNNIRKRRTASLNIYFGKQNFWPSKFWSILSHSVKE
jgi:hypothetical protein